jgi:hypothetical protein
VKLSIATTRKRQGKLIKSISVTTNDPKNPKTTLTCEGTVKVPFEMQPTMVNFTQIERGAEAQQKTVKITRGDAGPLALELVPSSNENVKATLREIEPGEAYELDIDLVPPWPNQAIQTYVTVKTGVAEVPEEKIRVYARIAPRLTSTPARFTIPRSAASDLDLKARLVWSGDQPGKVLEVTSSDTNLTASYDEVNDQQWIMLHVPKDYTVPSRSRHFVTVTTDDKEAPLLRIQVYPAPVRPPTPTGTPGKPIIRKLPAPPAGAKPMAPGAKPTFGATKPRTEEAPGTTKKEPAEPVKPADKPAEKPD